MQDPPDPFGFVPDASAAFVRTVADAAPLLLAYVDADLRCRFNNPACDDWFGPAATGGGPADARGGRHVRDVLGEAAWNVLGPHVERALAGERVFVEQNVPRRDGAARYVQATYVPDRDPDTQAVRGVVIALLDISERKQTEDALRASENEVRYVTTHARCLLWHGTVEDTGLGPGLWRWNTQVFDPAAAQAFCPLDLLPGENYTNAWYRHRLPEGKKHTDHASYDALTRGVAFYSAEFGCRDAHGVVRWFYEQVYVEPVAPGQMWRVVGVCTDISERKQNENALRAALDENARLIAQLRESDARQRRFLRDVLLSVTEAKLHLCSAKDELPAALPPAGAPIALTPAALYTLRHQTLTVCQALGFPSDRADDLVLAVGEAGMNAIVHGSENHKGAGVLAQVGTDVETQCVQVIIRDQGRGIDVGRLPRATLGRGYSSIGTLGHGFYIILKTADRVFLLTGPSGTTIVLEQDRSAPAFPDWE